jgi:hypothetical protein
MTSLIATPKAKTRLKRLVLWLVIAVGTLCALWCANLYIFHFWAAYVPPTKLRITCIGPRSLPLLALGSLLSLGLLLGGYMLVAAELGSMQPNKSFKPNPLRGSA